jgi:TetR/AcrR family transcriptional repressor of lmrAB and yxaGH operons
MFADEELPSGHRGNLKERPAIWHRRSSDVPEEMEFPMSARPKHRDAIVQAALTLFRQRGYSGTGLNDIVELSGAPKGSLYHYFPEGKLSIAEAAVRLAGERGESTLADLSARHKSAGQLVRAYGVLLAGWMTQSKFRDGSPMTTALLETAPGDPSVTAAGREAFASWRRAISGKLIEAGVPAARAGRLAALVISTTEGSLIQARVEQSAAIIESSTKELGDFLDSVVAQYAAAQRKKGPARRRPSP